MQDGCVKLTPITSYKNHPKQVHSIFHQNIFYRIEPNKPTLFGYTVIHNDILGKVKQLRAQSSIYFGRTSVN